MMPAGFPIQGVMHFDAASSWKTSWSSLSEAMKESMGDDQQCKGMGEYMTEMMALYQARSARTTPWASASDDGMETGAYVGTVE